VPSADPTSGRHPSGSAVPARRPPTAGRSPSRARRTSRRLAAALALGAVALPGTARAGPPAAEPAVRLDDQTFGVPLGGRVQATFTVPGRPAGDRVTVRLHAPVDTPGAVDAIADGADPGAVVDRVDLPASDAIDARGAGTIDVEVRADDTPTPGVLDVPGPGVYPLTIRVGQAARTTFVAVTDPAASIAFSDVLQLAVVAGVADPGPWPTPAEEAAASAALEDAAALAAAVDAPLTLSLPPAVARPGVAGREDELLAHPHLPLDPSALVPLDGGRQSFLSSLVAGERALVTTIPGVATTRLVWVAAEPLSSAAAALLRDLGVQLVLTPTAPPGIEPGDVFTIAVDNGGDTPSLPGLAALAASPLSAGLRSLPRGRSAVEVGAALAAHTELERAAGTRAIVLADEHLALPDPAVTSAYLRFAGELPGVEVVAASELRGPVNLAVSTGETTRVEFPDTAGVDLAERAAQVAAARERAGHAASMLTEPAIADTWEADLDAMLARTVDEAEAATQLGRINGEADGVLGAVSAPAPFTFTLTGTSTELPLPITNTSARTLRVVVRVQSPKLTATDTPWELAAGRETRVLVPVTARSSGTFTVQVEVLSPDETRVAGPVFLKASLTRVTGLSQVATAGAVIALASWWYSHLRKTRRRDERTAPTDDEPALSPDAAEARTDS